MKGIMTTSPNFKPLLMSVAIVFSIRLPAGCRGTWLLGPPGPLNEQQANAVVHDPYPENDIAPSDNSAAPTELPAAAPRAGSQPTCPRRHALAGTIAASHDHSC